MRGRTCAGNEHSVHGLRSPAGVIPESYRDYARFRHVLPCQRVCLENAFSISPWGCRGTLVFGFPTGCAARGSHAHNPSSSREFVDSAPDRACDEVQRSRGRRINPKVWGDNVAQPRYSQYSYGAISWPVFGVQWTPNRKAGLGRQVPRDREGQNNSAYNVAFDQTWSAVNHIRY